MHFSKTELQKITHAMQHNFFAHMLFFPERLPSCAVVKAEGLTIVNAGRDNHVFNNVFDVRLPHNASKIIETTIGYFEREDVPFQWWLSPDDAPHNLPELLVQAGLHRLQTHQALYIPLEAHGFEQCDLRVERVSNSSMMQDFSDLVGEPLQFLKTYIEQMYLPTDYEQLYVGYFDERPVCCAYRTLHSKVAGIYIPEFSQTTDTAYHRALIQELLVKSQSEGHTIATTVAPPEQVGLYKTVGAEFLDCLYLYGV